MRNKVFLGGTYNGSTWREVIMPNIQMDFFNPCVVGWTKECQAIEQNEKENKCNIHLYVITSQMKGVFSIAEVIDSVHTQNKKTILQVIPDGFDKDQLSSLRAVIELVNFRGGQGFESSDLNITLGILNFIHLSSEYGNIQNPYEQYSR